MSPIKIHQQIYTTHTKPQSQSKVKEKSMTSHRRIQLYALISAHLISDTKNFFLGDFATTCQCTFAPGCEALASRSAAVTNPLQYNTSRQTIILHHIITNAQRMLSTDSTTHSHYFSAAKHKKSFTKRNSQRDAKSQWRQLTRGVTL